MWKKIDFKHESERERELWMMKEEMEHKQAVEMTDGSRKRREGSAVE